MLTLLRPIIGEHLNHEIALDPDLGLVHAASAQMTRIIMNLVLNARGAMPQGRSILLKLETRSALVRQVLDTPRPSDTATLPAAPRP